MKLGGEVRHACDSSKTISHLVLKFLPTLQRIDVSLAHRDVQVWQRHEEMSAGRRTVLTSSQNGLDTIEYSRIAEEYTAIYTQVDKISTIPKYPRASRGSFLRERKG